MAKVDRLTGEEGPLTEVWKEQAVEDYERMKREGLAEVGIVVAKDDSSFERGPKTIRVRMEREAAELQQIMIASELGHSSRAEELRLKRIELFWQVWQEQARECGDREVFEFIAKMRENLFGVEEEGWYDGD